MNISTEKYMSPNTGIKKNYYSSSISNLLQIYSPTHNKLSSYVYGFNLQRLIKFNEVNSQQADLLLVI